MSRFTLSCTTCALRAPGKDELLETLEHAPAAGFEYWGVAGPPFRTPGGLGGSMPTGSTAWPQTPDSWV